APRAAEPKGRSYEFPPAEARVLIGDADPLRRAVHRLRQRRARELGTIIVLREVRGEQMLELRVVELPEQGRGGAVVELAGLSGDAELEHMGIITVGKH